MPVLQYVMITRMEETTFLNMHFEVNSNDKVASKG